MNAPMVFVRRSYPVKAIRITRENIHEVAAWCGGTVSKTGRLHIDMSTCTPRPPRAFALVGDWILVSSKGHFKAYKNDSFRLSYHPA